MPSYNTVLGMLMMSERRGLFCRYGCEIDGHPWFVIPDSDSSWDDLQAAIALRDAHEVKEHGAVFVVFVPDATRAFNQTFSPGKKK